MPRVKTFKEEDVLRKAMMLFWEKGYHATSMQDLVDRLEINRASMYDTFGDKESLFFKAFELYSETNKRKVSTFLSQYDSVKEGFRALFTNSITEALTDRQCKGCFVVNTITELIPGDDYIQKTATQIRTQFEEVYYEYLKKGVASGEIDENKNIRSIASMLYLMQGGMQVIAKTTPTEQELTSAVNEGLRLLD